MSRILKDDHADRALECGSSDGNKPRQGIPCDIQPSAKQESWRDSFHHVVSAKTPKTDSAFIIADNFSQNLLRRGEIPMFNAQPSAEYISTNIQRNGPRDGTSPIGDWIAYGATVWVVLEQFEIINGQPSYLAVPKGIYTS